MRHLLGYLLVSAFIALCGCSSSDNNNTPDIGVTVDSAVTDLAAVDTLSPDITPDLPPANTDWISMSNPAGGQLLSIHGTSATNIYAVGAQGTVIHFDGSVWRTVSFNVPTKTQLHGVFALDEKAVYAVGDGLILKYDGTNWTEDHKSSYSSAFRAAWGHPQGSMYTVGEQGTIKSRSSSSSYWSTHYISSSTNLHAVWGSAPDDVYAVGDGGKLLHNTGGTSWSEIDLGVETHLRAIWGRAKDDIYIAGYDGLVIHFDGTNWTKIATPTSSYFYGLWGDAKNIYVVGHALFAAGESVFRYDGSGWTKMTAPTTAPLNAIWGTDEKEIFIVGNVDILRRKK
ncbi:MAG: hypothetical protein H6707_15250 [Deltaproteobacteria bacterium]|nr:hypothetical protein [Deltaproteobacteria bacterium]